MTVRHTKPLQWYDNWVQTALLTDIFCNFAAMKPQSVFMRIGMPVLLAGCVCCLSSCKNEKKDHADIITSKPVVAQKKGVQKMGDYAQNRNVNWLGSVYTIATARKADPSLPQAQDEQGNRYYDNVITVTVSRKDGSVFFRRTFSKTDFAQYISGDYARNGALLGVVFNEAKGGCLYFAASVGSPDNMSDNFVPVVVRVSRTGAVNMYEDNAIDTGTDNGDTNADEGV